MGIMKDLKGVEKVFINNILFNLDNLEADYRKTAEEIVSKTTKYGAVGIEVFKNIPVKLDDIEYNSKLFYVERTNVLKPNTDNVGKIRRVLKKCKNVIKNNKSAMFRIDIIHPHYKTDVFHYKLW